MNWEELERAAEGCRRCALCETRTNLVFGVGVRDADVMFVGEGPGENEDLRGEPFVGRGGQLLDTMLRIIDLDRHKNIYIANIVKCRPPKNRDPLGTELIKPRIVVCLGRIAAMALIKPDFRITVEHGQFFDVGGVQMTALYHPAALLRDPRRKPETFVDLKNLQAKIRELCPGVYGER